MGRKDQMPSGWLGDAVGIQDRAKHFSQICDNIIFTIINFMGRKDGMSSGLLGDAL